MAPPDKFQIGFSIGLPFLHMYARGDDRIGLQADTNTLLYARMW